MWNYGESHFKAMKEVISLNTEWEAWAIYPTAEEMWYNFITDHLRGSRS